MHYIKRLTMRWHFPPPRSVMNPGNTKEVRVLAQRLGVEMPITEEIYQVLYCGKIAREAALTLLGRARKDERSN